MEIILKYFPKLTESQRDQFAQLGPLFREWNDKINVISRKDIDNLYAHHILHSMALAKVITFKSGADILDLGTGGGLPGIPLAILFPETQFTLIDGTRKKILVVEEISQAIGLTNVKAQHIRAEEVKQRFDFVVSRAVASLDKLVEWSFPLIKKKQQHALPNGLLTLKGGDIKAEIKALARGSYAEIFQLSEFFKEEYYLEKFAIYVQA
ncbi:MAG TPA: 16S rRNA (guanine(527)-N(7))-methyltransferase RsmG [Saprospiraceae bacterium]|nr:16S rRNA (guanine(527)-N(7))-methyltransferase RsmG [Saprospiraceae bacterium]